MPVALLAHPSFAPKTIGEVVEFAKKEGGKLNIGTSAVGTGGYLSAELFKSITGVQATIVPYKGTAQLMNDLLGGHVPVAFGVLPPAMGNLARRHACAASPCSTSSASACCPTSRPRTSRGCRASSRCCTTACSGRPACRGRSSTSSTPRCRSIAVTDDVKKRINNEGGDPLTSTPEEYAADIDQEERKWAALIKKLNLKVE